jgi:tetraacyldisaccharide-1-P 4'-kinase
VQKADVVVVTKCPSDLPQEEREEITQQLRKHCACPIVFTSIAYDKEVFSARGNVSLSAFIQEAFTLVTGIANPLPLVNYLKEQGARFEHLAFADHHHFSTNEIQQLQRKRILTTEKDYVRLQPHLEGLYYLPIAVEFLTPTDANIFGTVFGKCITITNNKK